MSWFQAKRVYPVSGPLRLAQITDCHLLADHGLYEGIDSTDSLIRVLKHLSQSQWDCVLVTGDISQDHTDLSYQILADLCLEYLPDTPIARLAGNHDEHQCLDNWLSAKPFEPVNYFNWGKWHMLLVDSKGPTPSGWVDGAHLAQLEQTLAAIPDDDFVGIFCHHHPSPMNAYIDKHILQNGNQLLATLGAFQSVRFLAHGHVHQQKETEYQSAFDSVIRLMATPSTSMQFAAGSMKRGNDDKGPGYRTFELTQQGDIQSEVIWLNQLQ